ncbi:TIM barrel protein [Aureibaculum algae]|uniref:TIM barrel protein n=2 Tax=Aureibaculum algae TaxID=2584122 RepID=A0A5B7TQA7_9FLAO|nr:TIM barrel protein [Aureibaculum algae]
MTMQDKDLNGNNTMKVDFNFQNYTDVILEGFDNENQSLWKTRYIKNNPKNKNIGIQLVSVHDNMLDNPEETLIQLGRMGYSYVETFVYKNGSFYGQTPKQFKAMVEKSGMKFLGSMTFFDPEDKNDDTVINTWWNKTIQDHKKAGVEYLSTSNSKLKDIKTVKELQEYSNYYNKVGKLCKENGLKFVYHNHADEFLKVEGVTIYDYFLQNTNPEYVYFQSDVYWMQVGGVNPVDYFKNYPNRFISWHVKDYKELGESGKIDFKDIFNYQEIAGVQYILSEVEDYSFPPLFSVSLAWEYIYYELLK